MFQYKDFSFVNYVLNLSYIDGLDIYNQCLDRFNNKMLWELYLSHVNTGQYDKSFEDFKNEIEGKNVNNTIIDKDKKEKEIIKESNKIRELDRNRKKA